MNDERKAIAALANELNQVLEALDIMVLAVEWENLDSSMGVGPKQEEYNTKLRECEMCMVLFKEKFGKWTEQEFEVAYTELKMGNNPRKLYVYFKEGEDVNPSPELREFRDSLEEKYGHFYSTFTNLDSLKAEFLKQFMLYQSQILSDHKIIDVKDGKVMVGGKVYVNLQNISSFGNNNGYQQLRADILYLEKDIAYTAPEHPLYKEKIERLNELHKQLKDKEEALWDTTLTITKLSNEKCSERLKRAIDCFDKGDDHGAIAILKEDEIYNDAQQNIQLIKLGKANLKTNIDELLLKIKLLRPSSYEPRIVNEAYEQIANILTKVIEYGSTIYGENSTEVLGYCKLSRNLFENQPKRRLAFLSKAMQIAKNIYMSDEVDEVISIFRDIAWACEEHNYCDFDPRIQCQANVVELTKMKYKEQSEKYVIAVEYYSEVLYWRDAESSKSWFEKALSICRDMNYVEQEKKMLKNRIFELGVIGRDWEWLDSLMLTYKKLSSKEEILYACIRIASDTENNDKAIKYYEEALLLANELKDINAKERIFGGLSRVYGQLNDIEKQIEFLTKCLEIDNSSRFTYDTLAGAYLCKGAYQEAIDCADRCLRLSIKTKDSLGVVRSCNKLCRAYKGLKDLKAAEKYLKKAINYDPENVVCYKNLASFYTETTQIKKALDIYTLLIDNDDLIYEDSEKGEFFCNLGWIYYLMGDLLNAERCYQKSIDLYLNSQPNEEYAKPQDIRHSKSSISGAYEAIARFYAMTGEYNKAQEALDQSYAFCSDSQQMKFTGRSFWQGVIYRGIGEYQKAIDIFQTGNKAYKREEIQAEKALTLLEWGKSAEALDIALAVTAEYPDYEYNHYVLGCIYKAQGDTEKARAEFKGILTRKQSTITPYIGRIKKLLKTL